MSWHTTYLFPVTQPVQAERRRRHATARRDDVIQLRASAETKAILIRAAMLRGQKLSEFMLESSRREAEATLLDQRAFFLDADAHEKFLAMLDRPPRRIKSVRALLQRKRSWER